MTHLPVGVCTLGELNNPVRSTMSTGLFSPRQTCMSCLHEGGGGQGRWERVCFSSVCNQHTHTGPVVTAKVGEAKRSFSGTHPWPPSSGQEVFRQPAPWPLASLLGGNQHPLLPGSCPLLFLFLLHTFHQVGFGFGGGLLWSPWTDGQGWGKGKERGERQRRERHWSRSLEDYMEEGRGVEAPWRGWGCGLGWWGL